MEPPIKADASPSPTDTSPSVRTRKSRKNRLKKAPDTPADLNARTLRDPKKVAAWRAENGHTQAGVGERLIAKHGDILRYHQQRKTWLQWDGSIWREDHAGGVIRLILAQVRERSATDPEFVLRMQDRSPLEGALKFAADALTTTGESVRVKEEALNLMKDFVPVANGVIDLRNGVCLPSNPAHLFTKRLNTEYVAGAKRPTWNRFVRDITGGDKKLARWLQVYLGMCLSGRTDAQAIVWFHGDGGNGKGVVMRVLDRLFDKFAVTTPATTFAQQSGTDSNRASPELASFSGARLVTASETNAQMALDNSFVKWTTGQDKLKARWLNGNPFEFDPTHKTIISTNHEPVIRELDEAMIRRVRIVPLKAKFSAPPGYEGKLTKRSFKNEEDLMAEMPGILLWLMKGAKLWYQAGADCGALAKSAPCPAVDEESARFLKSQDSMGAFLEGCTTDTRAITTAPVLTKGKDGRAKQGPSAAKPKRTRLYARDLYAAYLGWCHEQGMEPVHQNRFGRTISQRGFALDHSNGGVRKGLELNAEGKRLCADGVAIQKYQKGRRSK